MCDLVCGSFILHKDGYAVYFIFPVALTMIICPPPPRGEASVPESIAAKSVVRQSRKKVYLTTKFPFTYGRALGSPRGRAGAKRLRGEQKARLPSPSCRFAPCHLSRTRERQNVTCRLLPPTFTGEVARRAGEGQNSEKSRTV